MFCPKCATQNLDDAKFCRKCGTDISLVPRAIEGNLPAPQTQADIEEAFGFHRGRGRRRDRPPTMDCAVNRIMSGFGFLFFALIAFFFAPGGRYWWFWMMIPGFMGISRGVGEYFRVKQLEKSKATYQPPANVFQGQAAPVTLPPRQTGELYPQPASVTEGTTRLLAIEPATRPLEPTAEAPVENK